jgi:16S rRNA U516 pseudouridylate synthase RsuA-like enzyme
MTDIRLNHFLSLAGVASRRAADALIEKGSVKVDDKVVKILGTKVNPTLQKVTIRNEKSGQWDLVKK